MERLIDDEIVRVGPPAAEGAMPLRAHDASVETVEDPTTWFASDSDVLESLGRLARHILRRR